MTQSEHKKQILLIHGGNSFSSHKKYLEDLTTSPLEYDRIKPRRQWKDTIIDRFPEADILMPTMPNSANAQFVEWAIVFRKIIPFLNDNATIIGHSLGAMFLTKFLHHEPLPTPIKQLILVAGGYNAEEQDYGSFAITSASDLDKSTHDIHIFHSTDDFVVPYEEFAKLQHDLPAATAHSFDDRNHFLDPEFPEIIELLKIK